VTVSSPRRATPDVGGGGFGRRPRTEGAVTVSSPRRATPDVGGGGFGRRPRTEGAVPTNRLYAPPPLGVLPPTLRWGEKQSPFGLLGGPTRSSLGEQLSADNLQLSVCQLSASTRPGTTRSVRAGLLPRTENPEPRTGGPFPPPGLLPDQNPLQQGPSVVRVSPPNNPTARLEENQLALLAGGTDTARQSDHGSPDSTLEVT